MHDKVKKGRYTHENKKNVYVIWKIIWYLKKEKMYFNVSKSTYTLYIYWNLIHKNFL